MPDDQVPPNHPPYPLTLAPDRCDIVNATICFAKLHEDVRYVGTWSKWLVVDGKHWKLDDIKTLGAYGQRLGDELVSPLGERSNRAEFQWCKYSASRSGIGNILQLARSALAITHDELDKDPWLFKYDNGTMDLRAGELCIQR